MTRIPLPTNRSITWDDPGRGATPCPLDQAARAIHDRTQTGKVESPSLTLGHLNDLRQWRNRMSAGLSSSDCFQYEQAEKAILECIIHQHRHLFLGNMNLHELPEVVFHLHWVERLCISGNQLRSLPYSFDRLKSLTHLLAGTNFLQNLPEGLSELNQLEVLDLSKNLIGRVTHDLSGLKQLRWAYLNQNPIVTLPDTLGGLPPQCTVMLSPVSQRPPEHHGLSRPFGATGPAVIWDERVLPYYY